MVEYLKQIRSLHQTFFTDKNLQKSIERLKNLFL